ncbi:heparanase-like protein 3 [Rutidosis leptorrhynchoides]|uniref:heparanase-like protein 3 n=1 Tax=Rutidosis leptorrhynchoides TaxID=125765 RepID=UPI003A9A397F
MRRTRSSSQAAQQGQGSNQGRQQAPVPDQNDPAVWLAYVRDHEDYAEEYEWVLNQHNRLIPFVPRMEPPQNPPRAHDHEAGGSGVGRENVQEEVHMEEPESEEELPQFQRRRRRQTQRTREEELEEVISGFHDFQVGYQHRDDQYEEQSINSTSSLNIIRLNITIYTLSIIFVLHIILLLLLMVCFGSKMSVSLRVDIVEGSIHVNGSSSIGYIDDDFVCATLDWWPPEKCDYGTCSWANASLLNLDLSNKILLNAIQAFSPLKLRLGGTLQDKVVYEMIEGQELSPNFTKNTSVMFGFTNGCLTMSRWDQLNVFLKNSGAKVVFGLNALRGRTIGQDGSMSGSWDSSNAEALIRYTANKGYTINGWELGNELSGNGIGTSVTAKQYALDTISLQNLVQKIYRGFQEKPIVLGPGGFYDANWFNDYVTQASNSLQVITHHIYNLGPGVDDHLVEKILDPSYLDGGSQPFRDLQNILKKSGTSTVAWVGEAGGAYNSGHNLVSNAFVYGFWYLDQLGMASMYDTKTYCRQTLIGGNYGLLNTTTFVPNPDYYSALLWHRLMGRHVLLTSFIGTHKIRSYAHCSKISAGITLLLINLDGYRATNIGISIENGTTITTSTQQKTKHMRRTEFAKMVKNPKYDDEATRDEYHLTAKDGDLHSQIVLLNGNELTVNSSGVIPLLEPIRRNFSSPINVAPFSIVFVHIPNIQVPACT